MYHHSEEGIQYQEEVGLGFVNKVPEPRKHHPTNITPWPIWYYNKNNEVVTDLSNQKYFAPTWQQSPVLYLGAESNENILANKDGFNSGANITFTTDTVTISQLIMAPPGNMYSNIPSTAAISLLLTIAAHQQQGRLSTTTTNMNTNTKATATKNNKQIGVTYQGDPVSKVYFPIYDSFDETREPVAIMLAWIHWASYFHKVLPNTIIGIYMILKDSCNGQYTYRIDGEEIYPIGQGDLHDPKFNSMKQNVDFTSVENIADGTHYGMPFNKDFCPISIDIYPSMEFYQIYRTNTPIIMTISVALVFIFTTFMFVIYDR